VGALTRRFSLQLRLLAAVIVGASLAGCSVNPATGQRQFNLLSRSHEIAIGEDAKVELTETYGGAVQDQRLQEYVTRVGMSMVPHTEADYASLPWEFTLLDSEVINAFALPGGKVFITRGLAERFTSEAQLAGVLGHEIGHVTARHANNRITNQLLVTGVIVGATIAAGQSEDDLVRVGVPVLTGVVGTGFVLKFNRDEELEADALGMRYMARAGYDPRGQLEVMQILGAASGGPRGPEWFATHPHPETRIDRIRRALQREYAYTQGNPEYQTHEARYQREFLSRLSLVPPRRDEDAGWEAFARSAGLHFGCACHADFGGPLP